MPSLEQFPDFDVPGWAEGRASAWILLKQDEASGVKADDEFAAMLKNLKPPHINDLKPEIRIAILEFFESSLYVRFLSPFAGVDGIPPEAFTAAIISLGFTMGFQAARSTDKNIIEVGADG